MGSVRAMECSSPQPCHFDRVNTLWEIMETFYSVRVGIKRAFLLIHQHWLLYGSCHGKRMGAPLLTKTLLNRRWRNQTTTKVQHWPFKKHHPNLFKGEPVKVLKRWALHFIIRRALFTTPRKQAAVIILLQLKSSATDNNAHRGKMFTLGLQRCCTALH